MPDDFSLNSTDTIIRSPALNALSFLEEVGYTSGTGVAESEPTLPLIATATIAVAISAEREEASS